MAVYMDIEISFINDVLASIKHKQPFVKIYNAIVGSGKTTSVAALTHAIKSSALPQCSTLVNSHRETLSSLQAMPSSRSSVESSMEIGNMKVIYTTYEKAILREVWLTCMNVNLICVIGYWTGKKNIAFAKVEGGRLVPIPQSSLISYKYDILLCHVKILNKLISKFANDNVDIFKNHVIVLDEIRTDKINSNMEHSVGTLLAMIPTNLVIMTANIQRSGPINYYSNPSILPRIMTYTSDHVVFVPTNIYQFAKKPIDIFADIPISSKRHPIDIFGWRVPDKEHLKELLAKIKNNSFIRRFITYDVIKQENIDDDHIGKMINRGIYDPVTVFMMYTNFRDTITAIPEVEITLEDQISTIKEIPQYLLIGCKDAKELGLKIYDTIARNIRTYLISYVKIFKDLNVRLNDARKKP